MPTRQHRSEFITSSFQARYSDSPFLLLQAEGASGYSDDIDPEPNTQTTLTETSAMFTV